MRTPIFQMRMEAPVRELLERAAAKTGLSLAAFVRTAVLTRASEVLADPNQPDLSAFKPRPRGAASSRRRKAS